ncbi:MAG: response regulator [Rhodospirillales bacterium]
MSTILLIEDEAILQELMEHVLSADGHRILKASDGQAGMALAREHNPDLIITDMSMPKMTGWQMIEALRQDTMTAAIPVIALTAHTTADDHAAGYAAGVTDYEEKPVNMARLKQKIAMLLKP